MKKSLTLIACTAMATPLVFAQAKNFEGLSLGATIANTKTTTEDTTGANPSIDGTSTGLDLNAQYNWALGQEFVLGVGLNMGTGNNKAGTNPSNGSDVTTKNRYALEFTPGVAISKDLLLFGKVAYLNATAESGIGSTSLTGTGYGLGVRGMVDKNLFWQAGYDLNQYQEKDNNKLKSSVFSLGVGYKF